MILVECIDTEMQLMATGALSYLTIDSYGNIEVSAKINKVYLPEKGIAVVRIRTEGYDMRIDVDHHPKLKVDDTILLRSKI